MSLVLELTQMSPSHHPDTLSVAIIEKRAHIIAICKVNSSPFMYHSEESFFGTVDFLSN